MKARRKDKFRRVINVFCFHFIFSQFISSLKTQDGWALRGYELDFAYVLRYRRRRQIT